MAFRDPAYSCAFPSHWLKTVIIDVMKHFRSAKSGTAGSSWVHNRQCIATIFCATSAFRQGWQSLTEIPAGAVLPTDPIQATSARSLPSAALPHRVPVCGSLPLSPGRLCGGVTANTPELCIASYLRKSWASRASNPTRGPRRTIFRGFRLVVAAFDFVVLAVIELPKRTPSRAPSNQGVSN